MKSLWPDMRLSMKINCCISIVVIMLAIAYFATFSLMVINAFWIVFWINFIGWMWQLFITIINIKH